MTRYATSILLISLSSFCIINLTKAGGGDKKPTPPAIAQLGQACDEQNHCIAGTVCDSGSGVCIDFVENGAKCDNSILFCNADSTCDLGNTNTCIAIE